jgi:hypothetical protein
MIWNIVEYSGLRPSTFFLAASKPLGSSARIADGRLHAEQRQVGGVDAEPLVGRLVGRLDVHVAQREPRAHEERARQVGVHLERLVDLALGRGEVHRALELHARHRRVHVRVAGRELERVLHHRARVPGVVLVEEQLGAREQRVDAFVAARLLGEVEGVVGLACVAEQVRRAADEREALGVGVGDEVVVVVVDEALQRCARVGALALPDEQLAQEQLRVEGLVVALHALQRVDGLLHLALRGERLGEQGRAAHLRIFPQ